MERKENEDEKGKLEGLPVNTSPYTQHKDLEDYKMQGYGTQGHLQPQPGRGAGASTDAPTEAAGGNPPPRPHLPDNTDVINRHGVP